MSSKTAADASGEGNRVLLVGYNGANNTGSEARLLEIVKEVREVMGDDTKITVPTLNERNLRRYLKEDRTIRIAPIPSIYFFELRRLVRSHDLIMLVEGSCYMDTWTSALLWAFLGATKYAQSYDKASLAYAVDAGKVSKANASRVRKEASKTGLIITRTEAAAERLRGWGVTAPMEATADTAFTFHIDDTPQEYISEVWPEADRGVIGFSVVNFHLWPVVLRPFGRRDMCYQWPYYYSYSRKRVEAAGQLARLYAKEADRIVDVHDRSVAFIAMEALDEPLAVEIKKRMKNADRARVFSSNEFDAAEMTYVLRDLDMLITSRYHASVLSLASGVPQIAIGHDLRLWDLYGDLGIREGRFRRYDSPDVWGWISDSVDELISTPEGEVDLLSRGNKEHIARARRNKELLKEFAAANGLGVRE